MAARKPKFKETSYCVEDAVEEAFNIIEELASEMREWADNMESGNLGHTEKCERVAEAADQLENVDRVEIEAITSTDGEEDGTSIDIDVGQIRLTITELIKPGYQSRAKRAVRAGNLLRQSAEAIRNTVTEMDDNEATKDVDTAELEIKADDLESAADEAEGVEFPGMYG